MVYTGTPEQRIAASELRNNLSVRDVGGGTETNPMWKSNIGTLEFEQALEESLQSIGLFAQKGLGEYFLTAQIQDVHQPLMGFDLTVTATVLYIVTERKSGKDIFNKTISVPYTANFSSSFYAVERLRIANEGAVKVNIKQLVDELLKLELKNISMR